MRDDAVAVGQTAAADVPVGAAVLTAVRWHAFQLLCKDESKLFAVAELPFRNHLFVRDFSGTLFFVGFGAIAWGGGVAGVIDDVFDFAEDFVALEAVAVGHRTEHVRESLEQRPVDFGHRLGIEGGLHSQLCGIRRAGQEAADHKLVFLEGRDKAGVVLANDLDAIVDGLTDPRIFGEKKVDFDLKVLERAGESVDISRDSDRAREDLGDLGIGKGIGVPAQFQLFVGHVGRSAGVRVLA